MRRSRLVAKLKRAGRRSEQVDPDHLLLDQMLKGEDSAVVVNQLEEELSAEQDAALERQIAAATTVRHVVHQAEVPPRYAGARRVAQSNARSATTSPTGGRCWMEVKRC